MVSNCLLVGRLVRSLWLWTLCSLALAALMVMVGAIPPSETTPAIAKPWPKDPAPAESQTSHKFADDSVLDEPLRLAAQALKAYQETRDYSCTLIKTERIKGQMQPENVILMKVRADPFGVSFKWIEPKQFAGQEVCYAVGHNKGMMRVKPHGLIGLSGFVSIDPADPRALENSHHNITEAGIGNLIQRTIKGWETDKRLNKTQVHVADYEFNKRPVTRVETIHADDGDGAFKYYRSVIYFDKENHLPVRAEAYDWPRKGGNKEGELLEVFSFVDLKLNVNLPENTFDR
jgi:hypothetical protein